MDEVDEFPGIGILLRRHHLRELRAKINPKKARRSFREQHFLNHCIGLHPHSSNKMPK